MVETAKTLLTYYSIIIFIMSLNKFETGQIKFILVRKEARPYLSI